MVAAAFYLISTFVSTVFGGYLYSGKITREAAAKRDTDTAFSAKKRNALLTTHESIIGTLENVPTLPGTQFETSINTRPHTLDAFLQCKISDTETLEERLKKHPIKFLVVENDAVLPDDTPAGHHIVYNKTNETFFEVIKYANGSQIDNKLPVNAQEHPEIFEHTDAISTGDFITIADPRPFLSICVQHAFTPDPATTKTLEDIEQLHHDIITLAPRCTPENLREHIYKTRDTMDAALTAQYTHDKESLASVCKPESTFFSQLHLTEDEASSLKANMQQTLETAYNDATSQEKKDAMNNTITDIQKAAQKSRDSTAYLLTLKAMVNEESYKLLEGLSMKKREGGDAEVRLTQEEPDDLLKNVKFSDLDKQTFTTKEGVKIGFDIENGKFSLQLRHRLDLFFYWFDYPTEEHCLLMAFAVKAAGYETITLNIDHQDLDHAKFLARNAYTAARLAGFPSDKIIIKIAGQVDEKTGDMKHQAPGDIFDSGQEIEVVNQRAKQFEAERQNFDKIKPKHQLTELRSEAEAAAAAAEKEHDPLNDASHKGGGIQVT